MKSIRFIVAALLLIIAAAAIGEGFNNLNDESPGSDQATDETKPLPADTNANFGEAPRPAGAPAPKPANWTIQLRAREHTRLEFTSGKVAVIVKQYGYNMPADERDAPDDPFWVNGEECAPVKWTSTKADRVRTLATELPTPLTDVEYQIKCVRESTSRDAQAGQYRCMFTIDEGPGLLAVNITGPRAVDVWTTFELIPKPIRFPGPWSKDAGSWIINMGVEVNVTLDDQGILYRDGNRLGRAFKRRGSTFFQLDSSGRTLVFKLIDGSQPMPARVFESMDEFPDGAGAVPGALVRRGHSL